MYTWYSKAHFKILLEVAGNFGFNVFLDTFMFLVLQTGCFNFFKLEIVAVLVFKI